MNDLLENLNKEQLKAVTFKGGPLLIVAGAGTGKTTVITRRIAYLIKQKLAKPEEILALTFTEKAAEEMESRVDQLLPLSYDTWISTFHSFCERVLKLHALDIGLPNDFELVDEVKQWILVHENFEKYKLDYYRPRNNPNKFIDALLQHFSRLKDEIIEPEDYLKHAQSLKLSGGQVELVSETNNESLSEIKRIEELAEAFHTYQKLLLDNNFLDFGDLINYSLKLFKQRPNILKHYQTKFKYILVDEFQDTNFAQYQLVRLLCGNEQNITVVGDDDQSIYKFRGASVSNILKFKEDFPALSGVTLLENYRSSQNILDLAYKLIKHNDPNRLEVKLKIDKRIKNNKNKKGIIELLEGKDLAEELDLVIKSITELKQKDPKLTWNDFAILIRANSASNEIIPRLEAAGIPYLFLANQGLYKKPLIAGLIRYLKLLSNFHDSESLFSVFNLPPFRIDALDQATITQFTYKKTLSLYEALERNELLTVLKSQTQASIKKLLGMLSKHTNKTKEGTAIEVFVEAVNDLGLKETLEQETLENAQNRELLEQFYKIIEDYEQRYTDKSLRAFLKYLELQDQAGYEGEIKFDPNSGPEALRLMTIHSAKGLEFECVFVVNMVDQRFPTRELREPIEIPLALIKDILPEGDFHLQEERRLCYVAMTRAKSHLYFSWSKDYGGARTKKPSLFLEELGLVPIYKALKATGKVVLSKTNIKAKKEVYKELPQTFSYSEIGSFLKCPLEYKYRYYLKLPLPGNASFSFGQSIHKTFQKFMEEYKLLSASNSQDLFTKEIKRQIPGFEKLKQYYERSWVDDWYENKRQKQEYYEKGQLLLKTFYQDVKENMPEVKLIEDRFELPILDYKFVGKIDRADKTEQGMSILDYKTGKVPSGKNGNDIDQLKVYQWALQDYFKFDVAALCYWYLEANEKVMVAKASDAEILELQKKLENDILEIIETIRYDLFTKRHKTVKPHLCRFGDLDI